MASRMNRTFFLAVLCVQPLLGVAAESASSGPAPEHYSLTLRPAFDKNSFEGREEISVRLSESTASISINAAGITFDEVQVVSGSAKQVGKVVLDKEKELATISVGQPVGPGEITIDIQYRGVLQDSCCGFYTVNSEALTYGVILSSARRVFPSFDEPSMKATFDLSAVVNESEQAISNGRVVSDVPGPAAGQHTVRFSSTPKMSPYLLTLAIGKFECESGQADDIPIRVCGPPVDKGLGHFALEAAEFTLHFYNHYFELKYPYGKLDFVGLPGIPGAMENTACILALDSTLFGGPDDASEEWLRNLVLGPVAHEMAHQWLGDLVTMKSQDESWLNEGMATWMEYKPAAAWKLAWNVELEQLVRGNAAMDVDSLQSTRPIRSLDAPDKITYDKSAAVLRMVENYVGVDAFRKALNSYVKHYAYKNVTSEDLWNELALVSGKPVDRIMAGFVTQPGVPALSVHSSCSAAHKTTIMLREQRFFADQPTPTPGQQELWQLPVCLRAGGKEACQLLTTSDEKAVIEGCAPVYANGGAVGYYRSFYDSDALRSLAESAESTLSAAERMSLVNDAWTAVRSGHSNVGDFLYMAKLMSDEPEPSILKSFAADLAYVNDYIVTDADRSRYTGWIRATFAPRVRSIDWESLVHASAKRVDLQTELLNIVGGIGRDPQLLNFSRRLTGEVAEAKTRNAALLAAAVQIGYQNGDVPLYDSLLARLRSSRNPQERIQCLQSLARFESPQLVQRSLTLDVSGELAVGEARALRSFLFQNPAARSASWEFLGRHWDDVEKRDLVTRGLFGDLSQFCDFTTGSQIDEFFRLHKLPDELMQPLAEALSTINECYSVRERVQPNLHTWLNATTPPSTN